VEQEPDWVDRFIDRFWEVINRICYPNVKSSQNLGKWSKSFQEERQGEKETPGAETSESATETI
jgi:hypothetical protein